MSAEVLQQRQSCSNVEWVLGEAASLPFPDASFDIVNRFAFQAAIEIAGPSSTSAIASRNVVAPAPGLTPFSAR
jgi:methyltransferase family protein